MFQFNPTVGAVNANADAIVSALSTIEADVLVTSELSLCGYPPRDLLLDEGFISESQYDVFKKVFKIDLKKWRKKFEKASTKPGASNKLYRKLYTKMYKKCGERGTTVGGDHGKETVDIAVPFFVNALK